MDISAGTVSAGPNLKCQIIFVEKFGIEVFFFKHVKFNADPLFILYLKQFNNYYPPRAKWQSELRRRIFCFVKSFFLNGTAFRSPNSNWHRNKKIKKNKKCGFPQGSSFFSGHDH